MAHGPLHLTLLRVPVRIDVADPRARATVERLWQPFLGPAQDVAPSSRFAVRATAAGWCLSHAGHAEAAPDLPTLARLLATAVNAHAIRTCPDLLVHAACVVRGDTVVALAARSGGGKSTLAAACLAQRWDYVTDEALWLQPDGAVLPYPRPLGLSPASAALLGLDPGLATPDEAVWTPADLGGSVPRAPVLITDVVLLARSETPAPAQLVPLHAADGFTTLLGLSFNHYLDPSGSLTRLAAAVGGCSTWRLVYSDAREAATLLRRQLDVGSLPP